MPFKPFVERTIGSKKGRIKARSASANLDTRGGKPIKKGNVDIKGKTYAMFSETTKAGQGSTKTYYAADPQGNVYRMSYDTQGNPQIGSKVRVPLTQKYGVASQVPTYSSTEASSVYTSPKTGKRYTAAVGIGRRATSELSIARNYKSGEPVRVGSGDYYAIYEDIGLQAPMEERGMPPAVIARHGEQAEYLEGERAGEPANFKDVTRVATEPTRGNLWQASDYEDYAEQRQAAAAQRRHPLYGSLGTEEYRAGTNWIDTSESGESRRFGSLMTGGAILAYTPGMIIETGTGLITDPQETLGSIPVGIWRASEQIVANPVEAGPQVLAYVKQGKIVGKLVTPVLKPIKDVAMYPATKLTEPVIQQLTTTVRMADAPLTLKKLSHKGLVSPEGMRVVPVGKEAYILKGSLKVSERLELTNKARKMLNMGPARVLTRKGVRKVNEILIEEPKDISRMGTVKIREASYTPETQYRVNIKVPTVGSPVKAVPYTPLPWAKGAKMASMDIRMADIGIKGRSISAVRSVSFNPKTGYTGVPRAWYSMKEPLAGYDVAFKNEVKGLGKGWALGKSMEVKGKPTGIYGVRMGFERMGEIKIGTKALKAPQEIRGTAMVMEPTMPKSDSFGRYLFKKGAKPVRSGGNQMVQLDIQMAPGVGAVLENAARSSVVSLSEPRGGMKLGNIPVIKTGTIERKVFKPGRASALSFGEGTITREKQRFVPAIGRISSQGMMEGGRQRNDRILIPQMMQGSASAMENVSRQELVVRQKAKTDSMTLMMPRFVPARGKIREPVIIIPPTERRRKYGYARKRGRRKGRGDDEERFYTPTLGGIYLGVKAPRMPKMKAFSGLEIRGVKM